jgi:hypothetical protein
MFSKPHEKHSSKFQGEKQLGHFKSFSSFFGLPPSLPFSLAALALTFDFFFPPFLPKSFAANVKELSLTFNFFRVYLFVNLF